MLIGIYAHTIYEPICNIGRNICRIQRWKHMSHFCGKLRFFFFACPCAGGVARGCNLVMFILGLCVTLNQFAMVPFLRPQCLQMSAPAKEPLWQNCNSFTKWGKNPKSGGCLVATDLGHGMRTSQAKAHN